MGTLCTRERGQGDLGRGRLGSGGHILLLKMLRFYWKRFIPSPLQSSLSHFLTFPHQPFIISKGWLEPNVPLTSNSPVSLSSLLGWEAEDKPRVSDKHSGLMGYRLPWPAEEDSLHNSVAAVSFLSTQDHREPRSSISQQDEWKPRSKSPRAARVQQQSWEELWRAVGQRQLQTPCKVGSDPPCFSFALFVFMTFYAPSLC